MTRSFFTMIVRANANILFAQKGADTVSILPVLTQASKTARDAVSTCTFAADESYRIVLTAVLEDWTTNGSQNWVHTDIVILQKVIADCYKVATGHRTEVQAQIYAVLLKGAMDGWVKSRSAAPSASS